MFSKIYKQFQSMPAVQPEQLPTNVSFPDLSSMYSEQTTPRFSNGSGFGEATNHAAVSASNKLAADFIKKQNRATAAITSLCNQINIRKQTIQLDAWAELANFLDSNQIQNPGELNNLHRQQCAVALIWLSAKQKKADGQRPSLKQLWSFMDVDNKQEQTELGKIMTKLNTDLTNFR